VTTLTATQARVDLFKLLKQAALSHEPIQITGRRQNAILISEDGFRAMQETIHLLGVPGIKKSLLRAKKAPLKSYTKKRPWELGKGGVFFDFFDDIVSSHESPVQI